MNLKNTFEIIVVAGILTIIFPMLNKLNQFF